MGRQELHADTGNKGVGRGFARPGLGTAGWTTMDLPRFWEDAGLDIDGAVWFRREVDVPAGWAGRDLALSLGPIDDFDVAYWNGAEVGATGAETPEFWSVPRQYTIPARLVKAGRAVIAVRVFDHYGSGGFGGTAEHMALAPVARGPNDTPLSAGGTMALQDRTPLEADRRRLGQPSPGPRRRQPRESDGAVERDAGAVDVVLVRAASSGTRASRTSVARTSTARCFPR